MDQAGFTCKLPWALAYQCPQAWAGGLPALQRVPCTQELGEWQARLHAQLVDAAAQLGQPHAAAYFGLQRLRNLAAAGRRLLQAASEGSQACPPPQLSTSIT